jgi:predicted RNA binding protein YcfA (HicA-like mRNA interferase family)
LARVVAEAIGQGGELLLDPGPDLAQLGLDLIEPLLDAFAPAAAAIGLILNAVFLIHVAQRIGEIGCAQTVYGMQSARRELGIAAVMRVAEFIREIKREGWRARIRPGSHIELSHPDAFVVVIIAATPSDHRCVENT